MLIGPSWKRVVLALIGVAAFYMWVRNVWAILTIGIFMEMAAWWYDIRITEMLKTQDKIIANLNTLSDALKKENSNWNLSSAE